MEGMKLVSTVAIFLTLVSLCNLILGIALYLVSKTGLPLKEFHIYWGWPISIIIAALLVFSGKITINNLTIK